MVLWSEGNRSFLSILVSLSSVLFSNYSLVYMYNSLYEIKHII